jgi:membrane protein YqaA with SNARE-associated domain
MTVKNIAPEAQPAEPPATPQPSDNLWPAALTLIGTILLTVALILLVPVTVLEQLGQYGYVGVFLFVLLSNATIVLPSPALAATFLAGKTLDPLLVGIISGLAAGIGESTGYLAGASGSQLIRSRFYPRIERWVARWGTLAIFALALPPNPLFDLAGIAAGTLRMRFRSFIVACTLGKTVRFLVIAWLGSLTG